MGALSTGEAEELVPLPGSLTWCLEGHYRSCIWGHRGRGLLGFLLVFHSLRTILTHPSVASLAPIPFRSTAEVLAESQQVM